MTSKPELTREQIEAMDETAGHIGTPVQIPVAHGGDMRPLVMLPANVVDGINKGTMSLNIEGWDD